MSGLSEYSPPSSIDEAKPQGVRIDETENSSSNIITVVRDPQNPLGKQFAVDTDGAITKKPSVYLSLGIARMHQVDTPEELRRLLEEVAEDPHAAIINASFKGIKVGEEFVILSEREIQERLGIPRNDRDRQKGVHQIQYQGRTLKAVGRFKENVIPSTWQYLDRDVDKHTPPEYASLSDEDWLQEINKLLPGFSSVSHCRVPSTSSRVLRNDEPVSSGNAHIWFKVKNPQNIERFRTTIMVQAIQMGMSWKKPRSSRSDPKKIIGRSLTTLLDPSVFTPGRLTFTGKPVVADGLKVAPPSITVH